MSEQHQCSYSPAEVTQQCTGIAEEIVPQNAMLGKFNLGEGSFQWQVR